MTPIRVAVGLACTFLVLGAPWTSRAEGSRPGAKVQGEAEVLTGQYQCSGSIFSDGQDPTIQAIVYLSGTSGLVSDFAPFPAESRGGPPDLDEMDRICAAHLENARASAPPVCALTPVRTFRDEFGNGSSSGGSFSFVCEGRRDAVIQAIGSFSRSVVLGSLR